MIFPMLLLLGTYVMTFTSLGMTVQFSDAANSVSHEQRVTTSNVFISRLFLSLATNVVGTLMIAYQLWRHQKVIVSELGLSRRFTRGQKVLLYLVESGALYCALQAVNVGISLTPNDGSIIDRPIKYASQVLFAAYTEISAMYPTIVIVLVNTRRSIAHNFGLSNAGFNSNFNLTQNIPGVCPVTKEHPSFVRRVPVCATPSTHNGEDENPTRIGAFEPDVEKVAGVAGNSLTDT